MRGSSPRMTIMGAPSLRCSAGVTKQRDATASNSGQAVLQNLGERGRRVLQRGDRVGRPAGGVLEIDRRVSISGLNTQPVWQTGGRAVPACRRQRGAEIERVAVLQDRAVDPS